MKKNLLRLTLVMITLLVGIGTSLAIPQNGGGGTEDVPTKFVITNCGGLTLFNVDVTINHYRDGGAHVETYEGTTDSVGKYALTITDVASDDYITVDLENQGQNGVPANNVLEHADAPSCCGDWASVSPVDPGDCLWYQRWASDGTYIHLRWNPNY